MRRDGHGLIAMQLDIFEHSRDLMLRNDVLLALEQRDTVAARAAGQKLEAEFPGDHALPSLRRLVTTLEHPEGPHFADVDEATLALQHMQRDVEPAAQRLWGDQAGAAWLVPLWRQLAGRAARLSFKADKHLAREVDLRSRFYRLDCDATDGAHKGGRHGTVCGD